MPDKKIRDNVAATTATVAATGKRFCLDHQGLADANNGSVIQRNKSWRWVCAPCRERRVKALAKR
jgi:hypothetical protein